MNKYNIAIIQSDISNSKKKNLENAERLIIKSKKDNTQIAVLPEMFICPYNTKKFPEYAESADGPTVSCLSEIAKKNEMYIVAGSIPELDNGKIYNTSFVFSPTGSIIAKHRKIHLFDISIAGGIKFKESDSISPGEKITLFETPWGKIGVAICFDIRFAELFRKMSLLGAKTVIVPAAFNMTTGPAHWEMTFRMRSVDNQVYMVGCAPARNPKLGYTSWAHSILTDPWGRVIKKLDTKEEIIIHEIDHDYVDSIRKQLPILSNYKTKGYIE